MTARPVGTRTVLSATSSAMPSCTIISAMRWPLDASL